MRIHFFWLAGMMVGGAGCAGDGESSEDQGTKGDTATERDGDGDTDSDGDGDTDSDGDGDTDSDGDADGDSVGDSESDGNGDGDGDPHTDPDTDADTETGSREGATTDSETAEGGEGSDSETGESGSDRRETETETSVAGFTCFGTAGSAIANAALPEGYCAWEWASGIDIPRGILVHESGDVLVLSKGESAVVLLHDDDGDGVSGADERLILATASGLNHGIAAQGEHLYASSPTTVFRWSYPGDRQPLGEPQEVVTDLPSGGHSARTLVFDGAGNLYVNIGSGGNLDGDSSRARVIRFTPEQLISGATFGEAELFADGTRNENALGFDLEGRLWGVENGSDNLSRADLGGDIHNDNPGEELNLLDSPGAFYGYPYCWSEGHLDGGEGPSTQWAYDPSSEHTDLWCRDLDNVVPPVLVLQAHSAPLGIRFYTGTLLSERAGDAFVAYHGSWNRQPETGYKVVHIPFGSDGMPTGEVNPLFEYDGNGDTGGDWPYRPVEIAEGRDGALYVTSDASGSVIAVGHEG